MKLKNFFKKPANITTMGFILVASGNIFGMTTNNNVPLVTIGWVIVIVGSLMFLRKK